MPQPKGRKWFQTRQKVEDLTPRILGLRRGGGTFEEIGRAVGLKKGTVQAVCVRHGAVPHGKGRGRVNRKKGERGDIYPLVQQLRTQGLKSKEIAKRLGLKDSAEVKDIVKYWRTDPAPKQKTHDPQALASLARDHIRAARRYVGMRELCEDLRVSSSTFARHGISVVDLNAQEGFTSPLSIFQSLVENFLREMFPNVRTEYKFNGCVSPKGFPLRFDFFVVEENLLVEADGKQHDPRTFEDTNYFTDSKYRARCDEIKDRYAKEAGIRLVRIPYVGKVTRDYVARFVNPP